MLPHLAEQEDQMFKAFAIVATIGLGAASPVLAQGQSGWGMGPGWGMTPGWGFGPGWDMGQGWGAGPGWGMGPGSGMSPGWGMGPGAGTGQGWGMGPGGGMMGPGRGMMMGGIDTDQSGDISAEEAAAHAEGMFAVMDANTDGALAADEFGAGRMGMMSPWVPGMAQGMQERHAARFAAKDGDSDGKVTIAEFLAAEKAQYDAADGDGDGKVTPWELRAAMWQ